MSAAAPVVPAAAGAGVDIDELRARVAALANTVKNKKKEGLDVKDDVNELKRLKTALEAAAKSDTRGQWNIDATLLDDLLRRRMFVVPAFEIYGGTAGLYDFGPPACSLKDNLLALWRRHFVLEEAMLQVRRASTLAFRRRVVMCLFFAPAAGGDDDAHEGDRAGDVGARGEVQ